MKIKRRDVQHELVFFISFSFHPVNTFYIIARKDLIQEMFDRFEEKLEDEI